MNNLHRELAPISDAAWADIEEETTRTLKRYLAGRRVVDVHGPGHGGAGMLGGWFHRLTFSEPASTFSGVSLCGLMARALPLFRTIFPGVVAPGSCFCVVFW